MSRSHFRIMLAASLALTCCSQLTAQTSIRASLERLDRNGDTLISPEEITTQARPYLERIARVRRLSLDRPYSIERFVEAARIHHSIQNGSWGRDIRPEGDATVKPFGSDPDQKLLPDFGLPGMKYAYTREDLENAERTIQRYDRNRDGFLDRREAMRVRWTGSSPYEMDLNKDDRLSRLELAQRYARRRLLDDESDQLEYKAKLTGSGARSVAPSGDDAERRQWWDDFGKLRYVASSVISRFDQNRNGRLEVAEIQAMGLDPGKADTNRDGQVSRDEIHAFLATLEGESSVSPEGLPAWFFALDENRDNQVAMSEFTDEWTDAKLREFTSLDINSDGLLTAQEASQAKSVSGGDFYNDKAVLLPPKKTVISEIEISEDFLIGDLNIQLSLTHSHVSQLDGFLVGPDGQQIELFTEIGGSGDHFDQTVFDDESRYPITKVKPPFKGQYQPEALLKKQPSLNRYKGKSVKGVWQLIIRGSRNDRFGLLHKWALLVTPQSASGSSTLTALPTTSDDSPGRGATVLPKSERNERGSLLGVSNRESSGSEQRKPTAEARAAFYRKYIDQVKAKSNGKLSDEDWGKIKGNIERKWQSLVEKKQKGLSKDERKMLKQSDSRDKERSEKHLDKVRKKEARRLEKSNR